MNYDVSHVTTYEYGSRVAAARCLLHLEPRNLPGQRVAFASVEIEPRPVEQTTHTDFFGNRTRVLRFAAPHSRLVLRARSRVAVTAPHWPVPSDTPAWEEVAAAASCVPDLGPESPVHHVFASRHVPHLAAAGISVVGVLALAWVPYNGGLLVAALAAMATGAQAELWLERRRG
jgi:transglutaminase-like putative cysteine protease